MAASEDSELSRLRDVLVEACIQGVTERLPILEGIRESDHQWAVTTHPSGRSESLVAGAIKQTRALASLLEHGSRGGLIAMGVGAGGITEHSLAIGLVGATLREAIFVEGVTDGATLTRLAAENIQRLVAVAHRRPYSGWLVMGLDVSFIQNLRLELPWGHVRSGGASGQYRPNVFMAVRVPLQSWLIELGQPRPRGDKSFAGAELVADHALLLFAGAIALGSEGVMPPVQRWRAALGPGPDSMYVWSTPSFSLSGDPLTESMSSEVEAWAETLEVLHDPRQEVALERLSRALSERSTYEDQLIDAVIAWESICGAPTETTFRVTAALAKLLTAAGPERGMLRTELENTYRVRSNLVHGRVSDRGPVIEAARLAVSVARRALRTLYVDRQELIPMTSEQRATHLLLQAP